MSLLLLLGRGVETAEPTTVSAARVTNEPVDDRLFWKLIHADGSTTRWGPDEPDASGIPMGTKTSTSAPGGHQDASGVLLRDPRRDWPDLNLVDDVVIYGRTRPLGRNAFEGQMANFPSEFGDGFQIAVNAIGHQVLLSDDETFREMYVQLGAEGWDEPPLVRREKSASVGVPQGKIQASAVAGGLVWLPPNEALAVNETTELVSRVPAGVKIAKVGYRGLRRGNWANFEAPLLWGSDEEEFLPNYENVPLTLDGSPRTATFASPRSLAMLRASVTIGTTPAAGVQQSFDRIARYGNHGLPLREIEGSLPGVYGHDAIAHALSKGAPELNFKVDGGGSIIPNTSFVFPDLSFLDPVTLKAVIEKINAYFLNNWGVWDDKTFFWQPWDPTKLTWKASIAGGAKWNPAGRQAETLLNGIAVAYTDSAGVARLAGPPGSGFDFESPLLQDPDPNNPYTRRGRRRWGVLSVDFPVAYPTSAFQIGGVFLYESKTPQRSGTLVVQPRGAGHIPSLQHPTMGPMPLWAARGGDYAELDGWPEPEPFRMISTDHDEATKTLTAQLETGAARLSGFLERVGVRQTGILSG